MIVLSYRGTVIIVNNINLKIYINEAIETIINILNR